MLGDCIGAVWPVGSDETDCDTLDEDCDGFTDEDWDLLTDPTNCGFCGNDCTTAYANATGSCNGSGTCQMGACTGAWEDCNSNPADGCEEDTDNDVGNCGAAAATARRPPLRTRW